jgi:hypothetical protein
MRLPRVRFSIRWLMVAVAVAALALGAEATRRRWASFRAMAKELAQKEAQCRVLSNSMSWASGRASVAEREELNAKAAEYQRLADDCSRARKDLERRW